MIEEPRYHVYKTYILDKWENKVIEFEDMIIGHQCSYELPTRFEEKDITDT